MIGKRHFSRFLWIRGEKRTGIVSFLSTRHPQAIISQRELSSNSFYTADFHSFCFHLCFFLFFFLSLNFTPSDWGILLSFWQVGLWTLLSWLGLFQDLKDGGFMWQMRRGDLGEVIGTDTKWCSRNSILSFCFPETEASISYGYKQKNQQIIHRASFFFFFADLSNKDLLSFPFVPCPEWLYQCFLRDSIDVFYMKFLFSSVALAYIDWQEIYPPYTLLWVDMGTGLWIRKCVMGRYSECALIMPTRASVCHVWNLDAILNVYDPLLTRV